MKPIWPRCSLLFCLLMAACTHKQVLVKPSEKVDIALHCGLVNKDKDGCVVEDRDAFRVYVLTRKAMCAGNQP